MNTFRVFTALCKARDAHGRKAWESIDSAKAAMALDTAIDLWDGMTKGKYGGALALAVEHWCDAVQANMVRVGPAGQAA